MSDRELRKLLPVKCYKIDLDEPCEECDKLIAEIKAAVKNQGK